MKIKQKLTAGQSYQQVSRNNSSVVFLGGVLLGAMLVMMVTNQTKVSHYTLSDGSVLTTSTSITSTIATHSPPGGVRAPSVQSVRSSSSSEEAKDGSDDNKKNDDGGGTTAVSYERASRDSGGFFDDISDNAWALMKQRVKSRTNFMFPDKNNHHIAQPEAWYQENFEPDFTCSHERRIGGMGDGPKWVCDPHRLMESKETPQEKKDCLVYSVGSEGNFMFENAVMKEIGKHCEIHTFDPEIQGRPYGHLAPEGVNYHNWGFMSETDGQQAQAKYYANVNRFKGNYKTMKTTIEELGHVGREIDIFKIDCEGCEWTTFRGWFNSGATLRQILVEVHKTPADTVVDFFTGMQEHGYVTFHKEPNIQYAAGRCVEYAFLKLEDSFFQDD
ncbi:unnamed protein product [Cylindrotheca closterium]|uniref:Methyltransferase domain-containing protein n=1 Tax=Cylindrotheca closterium TaxID=2856 RepID=A0AAD2JMY9_9STRA|nr:unnamed protein product [Cylindrotheca closterium]